MTIEEKQFKNKVTQWVRDAFNDKHFSNLDVEIIGNSVKGEGFIGDVVFTKLTAVTSNGSPIEYNLVLKCGKLVEGLREKLPVRLAFEREIFIYSKINPIFRKFQEIYNINVLDYVQPKCFNTILYEKEEIIVLQNLKSLGYDLHDRKQPLDINHLKLTLEAYGKWHGLSMAFRDQNPERFKELFSNLECVSSNMVSSGGGTFEAMGKSIFDLLERNNGMELARRLRSKFPDGFERAQLDLFRIEEENCVLLHGDCWNNNMMFKYDKLDKERPQSVLFLDFQMSKLGSPVLDLAYHLYSTSSAEELRHFKDLLRIYHSSLSITIRQLGSDPEKLFPYEELVRQWRKYSAFGIPTCSMIFTLVLSNNNDVLDIQDMSPDAITNFLERSKHNEKDLAASRAIAVVKHFLDYDDF